MSEKIACTIHEDTSCQIYTGCPDNDWEATLQDAEARTAWPAKEIK